MRDFIAFFGELIVVIAVAGMFYAMTPEGTQKKYVHFTISLCVLVALIGPMLSVVTSLPSLLEDVELDVEENQIEVESDLTDAVISASRENIEASIVSMLSQKYDIAEEDLQVDILLDTENTGAIRIVSVRVTAADTTYVKRAEMKKYLSEMLMDHCTIEISE